MYVVQQHLKIEKLTELKSMDRGKICSASPKKLHNAYLFVLLSAVLLWFFACRVLWCLRERLFARLYVFWLSFDNVDQG